MRRWIGLTCVLGMFVALMGCVHIPGGTNLEQVAINSGLTNVTTGDGTFADYQAVGYYTSTEIGIGVGLGYGLKILELWPVQSNEEQMTRIADDAALAGANAMINATPPKSFYIGFPFFIIGIYVDSTSGTGIKVN